MRRRGDREAVDLQLIPWGRLGDQVGALAACAILTDSWAPYAVSAKWLLARSAVLEVDDLAFAQLSRRDSLYREAANRLLERSATRGPDLTTLAHAIVAIGLRVERVGRFLQRGGLVDDSGFAQLLGSNPPRRVDLNVGSMVLPPTLALAAALLLGPVALRRPSDVPTALLRLVSDRRTITLHMRLGDVFTNLDARSSRGLLSAGYWNSAISRVIDRSRDRDGDLPNKIVIFSDSKSFAASRLSSCSMVASGDVHVLSSPALSPAQDFLLLSSARTLLTSNSGFSWWAAVFASAFSDALVVSPDSAAPGVPNPQLSDWMSIPADWELPCG